MADDKLFPWHLSKEKSDVTGLLVWRQERDNDLPRTAALAS
jgi:hypothetical protein